MLASRLVSFHCAKNRSSPVEVVKFATRLRNNQKAVEAISWQLCSVTSSFNMSASYEEKLKFSFLLVVQFFLCVAATPWYGFELHVARDTGVLLARCAWKSSISEVGFPLSMNASNLTNSCEFGLVLPHPYLASGFLREKSRDVHGWQQTLG